MMNQPPTDDVALHRAQALAKAAALLCHLDRGDIGAFGELLALHGAVPETEPLCEVVLGMGEFALVVLRMTLGSDQASETLRRAADELTASAHQPHPYDH